MNHNGLAAPAPALNEERFLSRASLELSASPYIIHHGHRLKVDSDTDIWSCGWTV
jgi:hypothetical protein